jgi:hypothetical protein
MNLIAYIAANETQARREALGDANKTYLSHVCIIPYVCMYHTDGESEGMDEQTDNDSLCGAYVISTKLSHTPDRRTTVGTTEERRRHSSTHPSMLNDVSHTLIDTIIPIVCLDLPVHSRGYFLHWPSYYYIQSTSSRSKIKVEHIL